MLLVDRRDITGGGGKTHRHLVTETVGAVVPPVDLDRGHRKGAPPRELGRDQSPHQPRVDAGAPIDVHALDHPESVSAIPSAAQKVFGAHRAWTSSSAGWPRPPLSGASYTMSYRPTSGAYTMGYRPLSGTYTMSYRPTSGTYTMSCRTRTAGAAVPGRPGRRHR